MTPPLSVNMALDSASTASTPITPACNLITHAARQSRKKPAPFSTQVPTFSYHVPPCFFKKPYRTLSNHYPPPTIAHAYPHKSRRNAHPPRSAPRRSCPDRLATGNTCASTTGTASAMSMPTANTGYDLGCSRTKPPCAAFHTLRVEIIYAQVQMVTAHIIMQKSRRRRYVSGILLYLCSEVCCFRSITSGFSRHS